MFCKSGPFHHKSLVSNTFTSSPRERISAELFSDEIGFHWKSLDNYWICDTRLPTKVVIWFGGVLIHTRAIVESDHNCKDSICIFRADMTLRVSFDRRRHAHSLSLGIAMSLVGATRDLLHKSWQFYSSAMDTVCI
ncbi:uncharacterized protein TNIN_26921 [Trichonephila inaurata madagascariensis]|uniref:Uncharacterized protein n=1 Tax=Trichonephila inaurata madagascariensis TaxID=2747483 RepID=A0A8X6WLV9_9ARAC|nr:uncharacterized protein TNIN_26921 [Trichonephila inaurata madagascariensis]